MKFFNNRRFKYGSLATVITIGFIVALVLINAVASILLERYPLTIDLTSDKRFQLTKDSIDYIKKIDRNIKITICTEEEYVKNSFKEVYEVIQNYPKYSKKISVEFVDLNTDPTFAQNHSELMLQPSDIVVESNIRSKKIPIQDLFSQTSSQSGKPQNFSNVEKSVTSSIMYAMDENPATVTILTGSTKVDVSGYQSLLQSNNYNVKVQNLLSGQIDPNSSFVVLPQPISDLTAQQAESLNKYLDNNSKFGKGLIFIASYQDTVQPILKNFLAEWGIEVGDSVIYDTDPSNQVGQNGITMINDIADEDIKSEFENPSLPLIVSYAKPINTLFGSNNAKDNRKISIISKTKDSAILVPKDADNTFDLKKQPHKAFNTIVVGSRTKYNQTEEQKSYVLAIGAEMILNTNYLQYSGCSNGSLITALSNQLAQKKDTIQIVPVALSDNSITVTQAQVMAYNFVLVFLIPIALLITGLVIWIRRRHL